MRITTVASAPSTTDSAAPLVAGVALAVRDLDRVAQFYRDMVGLELIAQTTGSATLGAHGVAFLELFHRPERLPRDPAAAGLYHVAFLLPARADLGRWLRHAAEQGVRLDGAADHLVSEAVYLHDPEGNGVEIYADRPRAEWQWENGQVAMTNDRLDMIGLRGLAVDRWQGAPAGTRIGHVHLQVGDIATAERFYVGRLGLDVTRSWPQALFMSTGGYHHHIAVNTWQSAGAGVRDPARAGIDAVVLASAGRPEPERNPLCDPWGTIFRFDAHEKGEFA